MPVEWASTGRCVTALRESFDFALLVANTVECLLLLGETRLRPLSSPTTGAGAHGQRLAPCTCTGPSWTCSPVTWRRRSAPVEQLEALGYNNEELWLWLAEIGAAAELWSGRARSARDRVDRAGAGFTVVPEGRARRAGCWPSPPGPPPTSPTQVPRSTARSWLGSCSSGPTRRAASAPTLAACSGRRYGTTFDAELARLRAHRRSRAWRAAKDTWASHDVPHHAAYAGWRLAVLLATPGDASDAESELAAAYAAAEHHVPLRLEIEALARRSRLPLPTPSRPRPMVQPPPRRP